jgi:hypothetical protein
MSTGIMVELGSRACVVQQAVRAIAGGVFGEPRSESMIGINQLRWWATHSRVAQPHR